MNIGSCWLFEQELDLDRVKAEFEKMAFDPINRGKFRQFANQKLGQYTWSEVPNFSIDDHVHSLSLGQDASEAALRELVAELACRPMARDRPLWHAYAINHLSVGLSQPSPASLPSSRQPYVCRSAVVTFFHHAITDGQGGVYAALRTTANAATNAQHTGSGAARRPAVSHGGSLSSSLLRLPSRLGSLLLMAALLLIGTLRMLLMYLKVMVSSKRTFTAPTASIQKAVAWSQPISLATVKQLKEKTGCSVNDIIVTTLCIALRLYLQDQQQFDGCEDDLLVGIPASVRAPSDHSLSNQVSIVNLYLPIRLTDPIRCLRTIQSRMNRLKNGPDVPLGGYFLRFFGSLPSILINESITTWFLSKYHAVFTNVPGPAEPLVFAGQVVRHYAPIIPGFTPGGLGLAIISYGDSVTICIQCDKPAKGPSVAAQISDNYFHAAFEELSSTILLQRFA